MTDSLLDTIRAAICDAEANADATDDAAHIEAAYEACEHISGRVDAWQKANHVPADTLRAILNGDGSAADKIEALHELVPESALERELAGVRDMNLQLADCVRELLEQVGRQADTITALKAGTPGYRTLPASLELMRHKHYGTVITVKGAHRSPEGWVRIHRVRDYERSGPVLTRLSAYPEDITPITEEVGQ